MVPFGQASESLDVSPFSSRPSIHLQPEIKELYVRVLCEIQVRFLINY